MCRLSDAELNCVRTKMRRMSACRQLLIGMSISRYWPAIGTAGFERSWVSGKRRVPCPPPRMMARTSLFTNIGRANATSGDSATIQRFCRARRTLQGDDVSLLRNLLPREERFYHDFHAMAEELERGARKLKEMLAPDHPVWDKADEIKEVE